MAEKLRLISEAGYDGVECSVPEMEPAEWNALCAKYSLGFIGDLFAVDAKTFVRELGRGLPVSSRHLQAGA
jgi:sugar phosphate isomerase/epimerase